MKVKTFEEAWNLAARLFPSDWLRDEEATQRAGYPIYRSTKEGYSGYICDLGDRLELNYSNGTSENIWFGSTEPDLYTLSLTESELLMLIACLDNYCDKKLCTLKHSNHEQKSVHYDSYNRHHKLLKELLASIS